MPRRFLKSCCALLVLSGLGAGSTAGADAAGLTDDENQPKKKGACVDVRTEARFRGYAFDHVVELTSRCDKAMRCTIKSGIDASQTKVELAPGETKSVKIFSGSPASEVKAEVRCEPADSAAKP